MTMQSAVIEDRCEAGYARMLRRIDLVPWLVGLLACAILAPLCLLVYGAFTTVPIGTPFAGFTLGNFVAVVTNPVYLTAFGNTVFVGVLSTALAALLGIPLSWLVVRTDVPWRGALRIGVMVPFFLSPFIGALAWTLLLQRNVGPINIALGALGFGEIRAYSVKMIIWVMGLYYAPYIFLFVSSALHNIDPSLEEAGHLSGLNRRQVVTHVTVPLVAPAVLSGLLLTFMATAGQFGVPALLGTQVRFFVLTTYMYQLLNRYPSQYNLAAALGIVMLVMACCIVWLQARILRGRSFVTLGGKGFRPRIIALGRLRWPAFAFAAAFILVSAILPLAMLLWVSLVSYYDATFSWSILSTINFHEVFVNRPIVWRAIGNTLLLSTGAACVAVVLAVVVNWVLHRSRSILRKPLEYLLVVPVAVPHVVLGIGMLWTYIYVPLPIYGTAWILLIGYVTGFITQAVRNIGGTFVQIDKALEEAATMVGASRLRTMAEVTLPLLKPGMIGAWMLLFIIFVRELSTSIFLYSPGNEVLSVLMFNMLTEGDWGPISALAVGQILMMGSVLLVAGTLFKVDLAKT